MDEIILSLLNSRVPADKVKRISGAKGGEYCSPCPSCGGDDRFRCWPAQDGGQIAQQNGVSGTWWCRQCGETGDAISLLMFADGLTFRAACKELRIELSEAGRHLSLARPLRQPQVAAKWEPTVWDIPAEIWRKQATKLAHNAHAQLLESSRGLAHLKERGIPLEAVLRYGLGVLQGEDKTGTCLYRATSAFGLPSKQNPDGSKTRRSVVWIPRGFIIPQWVHNFHQDSEVHRLRIRRPECDLRTEKDYKFMLLKGSGQAPMALRATEGRDPALTVWVVVEAELDAMAVHHACGGTVAVVAVLTNRGKPDAAVHTLLAAAPLILVALDFDEPKKNGTRPGYQGWEWWKENYSQAKRWPVPVGKDPGEALKEGIDLADWIDAALPASLRFRNQSGNMGTPKLGSCSLGVRETTPSAISMPPEPTRPSPCVKKELCRWAGAGADTSLTEVVLPPNCQVTVMSLRKYFAGRSIAPDLLIPCPKPKPRPWYWLYYKSCENCPGHRECLLDFVLSPQMRASATTQNTENPNAA